MLNEQINDPYVAGVLNTSPESHGWLLAILAWQAIDSATHPRRARAL
jgi:hypothetical protein